MHVALGEIANMRNIQSVRTQVLEALQTHEQVELDLSQVLQADLSFLQLIEGARKFAGAQGKALRLTGAGNPVVDTLLDRAGFLADSPSDVRQFWQMGDVQ